MSCFFFYCSRAHRALRSFPTRRSSDLGLVVQLEPLTAVVPIRATRGHDHLVGADFAHVVVVVQRAPELSVNARQAAEQDRKSTRLNSSHVAISYAVFCLKKKKTSDTKY